ncbi:hypothetical protein SOCEGT47_061150 [Sorangium cellulosum]|uniref:DUF2254 domain-containing protein n=1 Tax=Sorangium cellulosum TaxID=56 RepID=A0A4P2Q7R3_SORCE|nr:DUF2254 family protein [Sorangium cellulosum]AUX25567.1 hypothetical protein SOCEGT47_061150 [Sorangium cellulosum]
MKGARTAGDAEEPRGAGAAAVRIWLRPLSSLLGVSMAALCVVYLIDLARHQDASLSFWEVFLHMSPGDAEHVMGGIGEVIAAILGIVITVASIIVQLAANRYTPRITEMFFRDRTNLLVMGFFVVSAVFSLWVNFSIRDGASGSTEHAFVPHHGVLITMGLLTACLLMMAPYFGYVFDFLEPDNVVGRIKKTGVEQALRPAGGESDGEVDERRVAALSSLEQLADVALNALDQKDKGIASKTVDSLSELVVSYLPNKKALDPRWFQIRDRLARDTDFVSMNAEALGKLSATRTWLEYKALRQFLMVYREALTAMPDLITRIAIDTRYIGQTAIAAGDRAAVAVVVKFFNTYMRRALNAKDIAAAYNNLNQYRYLAEELLKAGWGDQVVDIARYFKYYAQTAHAMGLAFVTETVAFDLCVINERAYDLHAPARDELLRIFLDVDKEVELDQQEPSLRGVRKAQVKLATYYLQKGEEALARKIYRDMRDERPDRLRSIRAELLAVTSNEFWEINDRGAVFEYIEPERRQLIHRFFEWFPATTMREPIREEHTQD